MSNVILNNSTVAEENANSLSIGIASLDGVLTASGVSVTNTAISRRISGINERSESAISALKATIRTDIGNIRTVSEQFEELDAKMAAINLLSEVVND